MSSLNDQGYLAFEDFLPERCVSSALHWIGAARAQSVIPNELQPAYEVDGRLRKLRRLFWHDTGFWKAWLVDAGLPSLVLDLVGPGACLIRHATFLKPARTGSAVVPHQDQALWALDYPGALSFWMPFVETNQRNGCLKFWPRSHRLGRLAHDEQHGDRWQKGCDPSGIGIEPVERPLRPGGMLVWDRYMIHASGPNLSESDRTGMVMVFADSKAKRFYSPDLFDVASI